MSNKISDLDYSIQKAAKQTFDEMNASMKLKELGVEKVAISETRRSLAVQMAYYSRGRMQPGDVKRMYSAAGLYDISENEAKKKNTNTLYSNHLSGQAIDFVPVKDGRYWWTAPEEVWEEMGKIGEANGFKWGGRWKDFPDSPHFEKV
ncbi:MAG: M15 family metallopeptidase [Methanobrevibacter sp.]|nr:M15 family metallopeptidase [Methanobrevibacter sp.]MBO7712244.1 M15 family metallopeptidase [Methanobrevibacter sp.]